MSKKIYGKNKYNGSWNFGPDVKHVTVKNVISKLIAILNINKKIHIKSDRKIKETGLLSLKSNKSKNILNWKIKLSLNQCLKIIAEWYLCYIKEKNIEKLSKKQIESFFMIDGVKIIPKKQIIDERGKIMHMIRNDDEHFTKFGEVYFSYANQAQ